MPRFDSLVIVRGCLIPQGVHHRVPESLSVFYPGVPRVFSVGGAVNRGCQIPHEISTRASRTAQRLCTDKGRTTMVFHEDSLSPPPLFLSGVICSMFHVE